MEGGASQAMPRESWAGSRTCPGGCHPSQWCGGGGHRRSVSRVGPGETQKVGEVGALWSSGGGEVLSLSIPQHVNNVLICFFYGWSPITQTRAVCAATQLPSRGKAPAVPPGHDQAVYPLEQDTLEPLGGA